MYAESCYAKEKYRSRYGALQVLVRRSQRRRSVTSRITGRKQSLHVDTCVVCGWYHIGSQSAPLTA